jgi:hypothetical protein
MQRLRTRLTYGNVVATLALFAALTTGGAYAASQLGKNSVGPKQLRKGAVNSRALKNGGVAARDLSKSVRGQLAAVERANVTSDGSLDEGSAARASFVAPNTYTVTFKRSVADCSYSATLARGGTADPTSGSAVISGSGGRQVTVSTSDGGGTPIASGFHLLVAC